MRTLILSVGLSVGALIGLGLMKADASLPGEVPHARSDPGYAPIPYAIPASYFGTTYGDPYDLLYYAVPPSASYRPSSNSDRGYGFTPRIPAEKTVRGQVKSVSADNREFVLGDEHGKDWTFHLTRSARVLLNDRGSSIPNLEVGDRLAVTYEEMGYRLVAITVQYSDRLAGLGRKMIP